MSETGCSYLLGELDRAELAAHLRARFAVRVDGRARERRTYADTFDGRLRAAGGTLCLRRAGRERRLEWSGPGGAARADGVAPEVPGLAADLPGGPLRAAVAPLLDVRRLFPLVDVDARAERLAVLDDEEKTVARLVVEDAQARLPRGPLPAGVNGAAALPDRVRVLPLRGYEREAAAVEQFLAEGLGLRPDRRREVDVAWDALGRRPPEGTARFRVELDPGMRTDAALRAIFRRLLDAVRRNEAGTLADWDSEFLHDFRVAVRRTRAALTQVKGVLEPADHDRFKGELRWLGGVTGPTRDLDVLLLRLPEYAAGLPDDVRGPLASLEPFLRGEQRRAQRNLARALRSARYRELVDAWGAYLESPLPAAPTAPRARLPVQGVASERIAAAWRRVRKRGRAVDADTPDERVHALRIEAKKLRYLLEFFRSLYPEDEIGPLVKGLKGLQDVLGDFNDRAVHAAWLRAAAPAWTAGRDDGTEALLALGQLLEGLRLGQAADRARFARRFERFDGPAARATARRLFRPSGPDPERRA